MPVTTVTCRQIDTTPTDKIGPYRGVTGDGSGEGNTRLPHSPSPISGVPREYKDKLMDAGQDKPPHTGGVPMEETNGLADGGSRNVRTDD